MNPDFSLFHDFNQMLVASVFFHFLFLTTWVLLPKSKLQTEFIFPAFIVSLEETQGGPEKGQIEPTGNGSFISEIQPTVPPIETASPKPVVQESEVPPPLIKKPKHLSTAKPTPPPSKPVAQKSETALLMEELDVLSGGKAPRPILEELDLLTKVTVQKKIVPVKKIIPAKKAFRELKTMKRQIAAKTPKPPTQIQEQTIREKTGNLKPLFTEQSPGLPAIALADNPVDGLEELDAKQPSEPLAIAEAPKPETADEPLKYAKLSDLSETMAPSNAFRSDYEDLLKDLDVLQKTQTTPQISVEEAPNLKIPKPETKSIPVAPLVSTSKESLPETIAKITQKILVPEKAERIEIDISPTAEFPTKKFTSRIRTAKALSAPKLPGGDAAGPIGGSSNPLALYKGQVKLKIDSNWKIPLGIEHKMKIQVAFFIFSEGNIEKPQLKISSGDDQLDGMAIKAILDSSPFPKFSKELIDYLKEPNINITMRFKLTPSEQNEKPN